MLLLTTCETDLIKEPVTQTGLPDAILTFVLLRPGQANDAHIERAALRPPRHAAT